MNILKRAFLFIILFSLVSCGGDGDNNADNTNTPPQTEPPVNITGKWGGGVKTSTGTYGLLFDLIQNGTTVTGTLTIQNIGEPAQISNGVFEDDSFIGIFKHDFGTVEYDIFWQMLVSGNKMMGYMQGTMKLKSTPVPVSTSWNGTAYATKQ